MLAKVVNPTLPSTSLVAGSAAPICRGMRLAARALKSLIRIVTDEEGATGEIVVVLRPAKSIKAEIGLQAGRTLQVIRPMWWCW